MGNSDLEIEAKFYVMELGRLADRLHVLGAREVQPRTHEINLRFDNAEKGLSAQRQVLRLRKDRKTWLTFKGPAQPGQAVGVRQEIEFEVSSFEDARSFLLALGFQIFMVYEKYRRVYQLGEVLVMLDELPYGLFTEIEGPDAKVIERAAGLLNLKWDARCPISYLDLFFQVKSEHRLPARNLCFEDFKGIKVTSKDLGVSPAD
jgi:adenylate cyclase class 2